MKKKVSLTYLFGVVFILTSALYFFASNWQEFSRLEKVALAGTLIVLFYGASFLLDRVLKGAHFLSNWLLVSGVISFGLSVALLGQLYNSHADSYLLFLVWSIPALLFSLYTRYGGFYSLTHILLHLTIYFYLFPSTPFGHWTLAHVWIAFGVGIANMLLFLIIKKGYIHSKPLHYLSLVSANLLLIVTAFDNQYSAFFTLFYLGIIGVGVYRYFHKETSIFIILSMFGTGFVIIKMFELMARYVSSLFFIGLLLAAILLLAGSVFLVNYLRNHSASRHWTKTIFVASVTTIASVFIVASIFGLLSLFMVDVSMTTLFVLATVFLVIPSTVTNWPSPVKYSLMMTGIVIGMTASVFDEFSFVMFFVFAFVFYFEKRTAARFIFYLLVQLNTAIFLGQTMELGAHALLLVMVLLNVIAYLLLKNKQFLQYGAFLSGFIALFSLTTIDLSLSLHIIYCTLFFLIATLCVYVFKKRGLQVYWISSLVFWFMLIVQLYYDLAWKLVHKSVLFAVLGIGFLLVAGYLDRKSGFERKSHSILAGKTLGILFIICLQAGWIGYQMYSNETLLHNGETVILELQPVDPRSLLQGDYVELNYSISQLEDTSIDDNGPVTIVLCENTQGVHEYTGVYKFNGKWNVSYESKPGDVLLNGKVTSSWDNSAQVTYGIEHFFIPEGTGLEIQGKVKTAVVKVSDKGDGILKGLRD
ncbi:GDYXXLXY domain-containing protein [Rossellomorea vietnamensis]|uniref:GDYXXLXY domain-containing protein n=1 Tax=Rossellomorea vietnamensis TaxID=218284 RepID=UPI003087895F|nr:GDYXXLXY domain-containing protein [Rossellomorea vietnamensis]WQI94726.1 GDYXXLXY domain-containing protein [Rossellomorea vietnamensis]